jgi:NAD(P)-dependent dehydrogenase (short-subunit alcohol dehydrogenase family)
MGSFDGRTVVITGGTRGIGEATGLGFVSEGAKVVSFDLADPVAEHPQFTYVNVDVANQEQVRAGFNQVIQDTGRVDVLVNNAGLQRVGLVDEIDPANWDLVVRVHLYGTYNCTAEALRHMKPARRGAIVNIASVAGFVALPGRSPYSAAKAGVMALTRVTAVECAEAGIRVNAIAPGFTRTAIIEQGLRDGSLQEDWMVAEVPMRRLADPSEIAKAICFMASDDASYITGQTLIVDGGWTVQGIHTRPDWLES